MGHVFFPQYKKGKQGIEIHPGLTILDYVRKAGIEMNAECGGVGKCGKCVVRIEKGEKNLNSLTSAEKKFSPGEKERLACQARIIKDGEDIVIFIKNFGKYEILKYGTERKVPLSPVFYREGNKVMKDGQEIEEYKGKIYGLAIDVGTTTIVFDLVDLETGDILATVAKMNPQISYGNDVISRIEYTLIDKENKRYLEEKEKGERIRKLQKVLIESINNSIEEASRRNGEDISQYIYEAVIVGNSTMRNLFFELDVSSLGIMPFEPARKEAIIKKQEEIGLKINPKSQVYGSALIGGHVGADILADILASEIYKSQNICMLVDIGTNGEIVLGNKDKLLCASCAAGGAFEGATVSCGTGGIEGAIKEIEITDGRVVYSTIGNKFPVGICGSGFIDLLAELLNHKVMSTNARIEQDFYITADLKITQEEIFQLITSKAAIKTGEQILLQQFPIDVKNIEKIYLSGGFGNFINIKNAIRIGLIPDIEEQKVIKIGNGALEGAREMLLCKENRELCEDIAKKVEYVKTNEVEKDFDYIMAENMYFDKMKEK